MADTGDDIFNNLPRRRKRAVDDDDARSFFRERRGVYVPEGPLPPRPHASGKGGPSINQTPPPPVLYPVNTVAPVASGTLTVGSTLSCTTGTWTNSPTSYAYQWQRGGTNISGATASSYLTVTADGGTSVGCVVTATNASGSGSQASNTLAIAAGGSPSVWSASDAAANGMTLTNGGLTVRQNASVANTSIRGTNSQAAGKVYVEFLAGVTNVGNERIGVASSGFNIGGQIGQSNYSGGYAYAALGGLVEPRIGSAGFTTNYTTTLFPTNNDVWALAVDFGSGNIWLAINNVWINSSNPATGALPYISFVPATVGALFPTLTMQGVSEGPWTLQPIAATQKYAPPAGFTPWG